MMRLAILALTVASCCVFGTSDLLAKSRISAKQQSIRAENLNPDGQETLVLPYAFTSDSMGTVFGVGGGAKGLLQEQFLVGGTVFGGSEETYGLVLGAWDYRPTWSARLFFTAVGSYGHYPRQRAYTRLTFDPDLPRRGSNDSDQNDFAEAGGENNWLDFKAEYVLPLGAARHFGMATYHLRGGMLERGATGGDSWNPLSSGITTVMLRQYNQLESYETAFGDIERSIHPVELAIGYNNTDYPVNPSSGSSQYLAVKRDFGWGDAATTWTFVEFEVSKYFDLGASQLAKQRVVALNFWTGDAPTWQEKTTDDGSIARSGNPPQYDGATLGGFYRMRGYPSRRFNDRAVVYSTMEYRYTPHWNPIGDISWLDWLKMDWWQAVAFIEGGRVANEYSFSELSSDWQTDIGFGLRAFMAGAVVRLDVAVSDEETAAWVMFGHPF